MHGTWRTRATVVTVAVAAFVGSAGSALASPARAVAPPMAQATAAPGPDLPEGWTATPLASGLRLQWRAPAPQPMGDARIEFFAGGRELGAAQESADRRTFTLDLPTATAADLHDLQVRAAGRRLDRPVPADRGPRARTQPPPAPRAPAAPVDPGTPGPYQTVTGEYALPDVTLPGYAKPIEMRGVVVAPRGTTGRRPLALFLHGRHEVCYGSWQIPRDWPCPPGLLPVPSHRGYLASQQLLASQGYVTVSIAANGVNAQDYRVEDGGAQARSSLVRLHLARWAAWADAPAGAPEIVRQAPAADLTRVLLVGHSRGGEGVSRAAMDSLTPPPAAQDGYGGPVRWRIRGLFMIAPTAYGQNPVPDVPSTVLLPGCDGDVADLKGQMLVDATRGVSSGTALHSALYMTGANHNFFNTEWTPGQSAAPSEDDWRLDEDPVCGWWDPRSMRLAAGQQQAALATYVAGAARLFVAGDERVLPLLDGSGVRAPSAGAAHVVSHAIGARRTPLLLPDPAVGVAAAGSTSARVCAQVAPDGDPARCERPEGTTSPHFVPFDGLPSEGGRHAVEVTWSATGGTATLRPAQPMSLSGSRSVSLRVVVPPQPAGPYDPALIDTRFDVAVTDGQGRRAVLGAAALGGLPLQWASGWAQEVRVPTDAARRAGLNLNAVTALELVPRTGAGRLWLIDAWGWETGAPAVVAPTLRRFDLGDLPDVPEGDSGTVTYRLPITVSPGGQARVRVFVYNERGGPVDERIVEIRPGEQTVNVPLEVAGNTVQGADPLLRVLVKAVRGAVVGDFVDDVRVLDDDDPVVTVEPLATRVTEGGTLHWRVHLSKPADYTTLYFLRVRPPATGPELSTTDVREDWLLENLLALPLPERPLSSTSTVWVDVPPMVQTFDFQVPTIADDVAEPEEHVQIEVDPNALGSEAPPPLTGSVTDP
jgi:hypothetical protein